MSNNKTIITTKVRCNYTTSLVFSYLILSWQLSSLKYQRLDFLVVFIEVLFILIKNEKKISLVIKIIAFAVFKFKE